MAIFPGSAIPSAVSADYEIDNSLRFDDGDSAYLRKVFSTAGNRRTWTLSLWAKRGNLGTPNKALFYAGADAFELYFYQDKLKLYVGAAVILETSAVYRDPSSWYHIVLALDTTQGTDTDRVKLYVNGDQVTAFGTTNYPAEDAEWDVGNAVQHSIGAWDTDDEFYDGYLAELYYINGTALAPSSFGELDSDTNQWKPLDSDTVKDAVTFGTNGFYQKYSSTELAVSFADSSNSSRYITGSRTSEITVSTDLSIYTGDNDGAGLNTQCNGSTANSNPRWYPNGEAVSGNYLRYDFGSGNTVTITEAKWYQDTTATQGVWKWQGSDDASSWTDIGSSFTLGDGATGTSTPQTQTELNGNTTAYRYYQLLGISGSAVNLAYWLEITFKQNLSHTITANGDVDNQRPQHHNVTANGDAHLIGPKVGASAIVFDGDEDFLSIPDSADWNFGTGDFTVDFWAMSATTAWEDDAFFWTQWDDDQDFAGMRIRTGGDVNLLVKESGSATINLDFTSVDMPLQKWFHFALVRSTSGTNRFMVFIDGKLIQTINSSTTWPDVAGAFLIGDDNYSSGKEFTGYIDEFRVSKGVARWTADFTPETTAYSSDSDTKLLIHAPASDNATSFTDSSGSSHTITTSGGVISFIPKVGAGAMAFDGTGDYYSVPDSGSFNLSGPFTVEGWVKFNDLNTGGTIYVFDKWVGSGNQRSWQYYYTYSTTTHLFEISTDGTTSTAQQFTTTSGAYAADTWYHIAFARDSSNNFRFFIDGTQVGSTSTSITGTAYDSTANFIISDGALNGYVDQCRISNGVCRYTSNFTPSTTAFTDDINTTLLLNADINQGTYNPDSSTGLAISTESRIEFDGSTDSLSIPSSSDFNMADDSWTIDFWVNFKAIPDTDYIFSQWTASGNRWDAYINNNSGTLEWTYQINDASNFQMTMAATSISLGRWYHVELGVDASTEKGYWYFDGVRQTESSSWTHTNPNVDAAFYIFNPGPNINVAQGINGYMDEFRVSKGIIRHTGATFTPETRGNPYTADSYTKLLIHSDYTGGLGADSSGNFNNFTATNLVATDQMIDTPTNNFATWNPLSRRGTTLPALSEGNLKVSPVAPGLNDVASTMAMSTGKWYAECYLNTLGSSQQFWVGITESSFITTNTMETAGISSVYKLMAYALKRVNNTNSSYGSALVAGDILGIAYNGDDNEVTFYKNNATMGAISCDAGEYVFTAGRGDGSPVGTHNFGQDSSFAGAVTAQGNQDGNEKGDFYYAPPSGFLALCTDNLPDPEIALPGEHFNTVLYTGTSQTAQSITGVGFEPDLVWIKRRNYAGGNNVLFDQVRGVNKELQANDTGAEGTRTGSLNSFDSDGWTTSTDNGTNVNLGTYTYVNWNWKAGGAGVSNTEGSLDATVSANTAAGFSIVRMDEDGTGGTATVGHGLTQAPELVIGKPMNAADSWRVGSDFLTSWAYIMRLQTTVAEFSFPNAFNSTAPTATLVTMGSDGLNNSGPPAYRSILYCFHSVEGYSKVGSYAGNSSADGTFVYCGFKPAYVLNKMIEPHTYGWVVEDSVRDPYNAAGYQLYPNTNGVESANHPRVDFVSNGFKWRDGSYDINHSSGTYLFLAFAESPFKYSNAR